MPLTDNQQAELSLLSYILMSTGTISVAAGMPWYVGLAIALAGAVGIGIKEYLGSAPKPNP
jgi:hypothetical protein